MFGGSWGSTLALIYAQHHPDRVRSLVLRGIFMCRKSELHWFYQDGASHIFPDAFAPYRDHIPEAERSDLIRAYYARLTSEDVDVRRAAAKEWTRWEMATSRLFPDPEYLDKAEDLDFAVAFARIECHYFINAIFVEEAYILNHVDIIQHLPTVIVQGRYDVVCPSQCMGIASSHAQQPFGPGARCRPLHGRSQHRPRIGRRHGRASLKSKRRQAKPQGCSFKRRLDREEWTRHDGGLTSGEDMTEGTITPEVQIKELQEALATETDRLQKLFAAYETQEKELVDAKAEIEVLEKEIIDREIEGSLESIIAEKDVRVRELEMKARRTPSELNILSLNWKRWKRSTPVKRTDSARSSASQKNGQRFAPGRHRNEGSRRLVRRPHANLRGPEQGHQGALRND